MAHPLTLLRAMLGLSQPEYAALVARTHRDLGLGTIAARREKVSRWESGRITPDFTTQLAMAQLHGIPAAEVRRLGWPYWTHLATRDAALLNQPCTSRGAASVLTATAQPDDARQPDGLVLRGAPLERQMRQALALLTAAAALPPAPVPEELAGRLAGIEARLEALESHEHGTRLSPAALYAAAHAEQRLVVSLLTRLGDDHPAAPRLFALAARTGLVCGWLGGALGEARGAERHLLAAVRAGAAAGRPPLVARALALLARHHLIVGDPGDALFLVRAARTADPCTAEAPTVSLHNFEAVILARLGRARDAEASLDSAGQCLADNVPGRLVGDAQRLGYALYLNASAGAMWCYLNQPRKAERQFGPVTEFLLAPRAVAPLPRTPVWLLYTIDTHLALGQPDVAAQVAHQAVDLTGTLPAGLAREYRRRLLPHRHEPVIGQALDHLDDAGRP